MTPSSSMIPPDKCPDCGAPVDAERGQCSYCRRATPSQPWVLLERASRTVPAPAPAPAPRRKARPLIRPRREEPWWDAFFDFVLDSGGRTVFALLLALACVLLGLVFAGLAGDGQGLLDMLTSFGPAALGGLIFIVGFLVYRAGLRRNQRKQQEEGTESARDADAQGPPDQPELEATLPPSGPPVGRGNLPRPEIPVQLVEPRRGWLVSVLGFVALTLLFAVLICLQMGFDIHSETDTNPKIIFFILGGSATLAGLTYLVANEPRRRHKRWQRKDADQPPRK